MPITLQPVDAIPAELRDAYLDSLTEPQELYVENRFARSRGVLIRHDGRTVGHAVIDGATIAAARSSTPPRARPWNEPASPAASGFWSSPTRSPRSRTV